LENQDIRSKGSFPQELPFLLSGVLGMLRRFGCCEALAKAIMFYIGDVFYASSGQIGKGGFPCVLVL
jgi:hypothetical protein